MSGPVEIAVPWLHGPVHVWLLVPGWLHEKLHAEDHPHTHRITPAPELVPGIRVLEHAAHGYWPEDWSW